MNVLRVSEDPILASSAPGHGPGEEQILHAYPNPVRARDLGDGSTPIVGPNPATISRDVDDDDGDTAVVIVHAVRARETFPR